MAARVTICLNMIVKNEAHVIADTLRNVCAVVPVTRWVICDTGSTDGTQEIIAKTFADLGIPGELHERPWVNFGHNRNEALQLCAGQTDFVLFFDADDQLLGTPDFSDLTAEAYDMVVESESRTSRYLRKLFVRNDGRARWKGVVHEFLHTADMRVAQLPGEHAVISRRKGARSQDPEKYRKDALLLEAGFNDPADVDLHPRYAFYCANSWRDFGDPVKALNWYERRVTLQGWVEEKFLSCMEAGLINERRGDREKAIYWLLQGHDLVPDRAECLYHCSRILRSQSRFRAAMVFAQAGIAIPKPTGNKLFLNNSIYDFWMAYEVLFLTGRLGGKPRSLPWYDGFMASNAPESAKSSVAAF